MAKITVSQVNGVRSFSNTGTLSMNAPKSIRASNEIIKAIIKNTVITFFAPYVCFSFYVSCSTSWTLRRLPACVPDRA